MNEKDWLDTATKKIYFRPDRKAVRRELEAHLEDLREVSGLDEDAARTVLTLHNDDGDFLAEGIRKGEIYLFYARPEPDEYGRVQMDGNWFFLQQCTYELAFYDADGNVIQETSG